MSEPSSFWARHAALVFALRTFAAAMLALSIAFWLDMPRPYWAMTSVYITSNPLTGATWSKAVYRMLGTLIGAAGTIALVPNLVNAPELLSLAIALWVGVFLYFSLIDGTPRAYVFLLSGYTVALLGCGAATDIRYRLLPGAGNHARHRLCECCFDAGDATERRLCNRSKSRRLARRCASARVGCTDRRWQRSGA
jgi:hypothetical protein